MKSDRLVVLLAPEDKARLVALARARRSSVGELVREAISTLEAPRTASGVATAPDELMVIAARGAPPPSSAQGARPVTDAEEPTASPEPPELPVDQAVALERLAEVALQSMQRANAALDRAFEEVEATKAYFAARRSKEPNRELVRQDR